MGCGFATVAVPLSVDGDIKTTCAARIAAAGDADDNPWARRGDQWRPAAVEQRPPRYRSHFSLSPHTRRWL